MTFYIDILPIYAIGSIHLNNFSYFQYSVDFWYEMFDDPVRLYLISPMKIIFMVVLVPAFIGIIWFIGDRPVK